MLLHSQEEKLYISDFSELYGSDSGIVYRPSTFGTPASCPPSVCLFVYDRNEVFRPVAIQLKRNDRDYLFTCDQLDTEPQDWLLAKMYYRCSVSNHAAVGEAVVLCPLLLLEAVVNFQILQAAVLFRESFLFCGDCSKRRKVTQKF